ncbi:Hypothetical predicted protein [Mytilus galloprovincialis]|uniref:Reverse transcriptase domain-containing protein n=1 Tax=Mytilus galloprovincialis TaxID=29158 RepID=A0A8B6BQ14_MYTGA|nr:Hypothetical predicted protein [Mytilus galloprovincialis]
MDISRLKSLRAGNKAAVTKVFKKLEEAIGDSEIDTEEVSELLEAIEKKKETLASIDEQILNAVESEDITNEILEKDEYYLNLEGVKRVTTDKTRPINTTDKSLNSNRKKQCAYCDGNHWPNECKDVIDHDKRVAIIKEKRLCFNCLLNQLKITYKPPLRRKKNNKYVTKLPWRENAPELPTNEDIAKRRTESVIRRLKKDPEMFRKYGEIITDQEQRGFIEKVYDESTCTNKVHYIPHHPVKKDSVTTPIRIVYNCSCRANDSSPCLNDCLATYPPIMTDLTEILVRFRMYKYAVTADIEKAFLHIELDVDDRDVTRFYWLENPMDTESRLITYRFKVVLFGATCSPFMLSATLMKHFRDNPSTTSTELQRNVYVDNVLTSFTDKQSLLKFYTESRKLLSEAGFNLRSWNSNSTELQNVAGRDKIGDNDDIVKILGMRWDRESDDLKFQQIEFMEKDKMITKQNAEWNYCPTDDNPADYLTRGIYAKHLYNNSLWMNGPQWILNRENWPTWTRKIEDCSTMVTVSDDNTDDESTNASTQTISCINGYLSTH